MFKWFPKKSRLEKLKDKYCNLMRKSYELSLLNREKAEQFHTMAIAIKQEIKGLMKKKGVYS